jgi:hypothetical protein
MRGMLSHANYTFFFGLDGADPVWDQSTKCQQLLQDFSAVSLQFLAFSFVDLVTMLLAQAPRLTILNSFLLGIISSRITVNT